MVSVWDLERATVRQFADEMASRSLPSDEIYQMILRAIWRGDFEGNGSCAITLPNADATGVRQGPGTTWIPIDSAGDENWTFPPFTREDLREALGATRGFKPSFDELQDKPASTYDAYFKENYLEQIRIETAAVKELFAHSNFAQPGAQKAEKGKGGRPKKVDMVCRVLKAEFPDGPSGLPSRKELCLIVERHRLNDKGETVSLDTLDEARRSLGWL